MKHRTARVNHTPPVLHRAGDGLVDVAAPLKSIDEANRTADFVIATERPVPMWDGVEVLRMRGLDARRYEKNPVVVDGHSIQSIRSILGSATLIREPKRLIGRVRFDATPEGEGAWQRVKSGSLRATSIGYRPDPTKTRHLRAGERDDDVEGPAAVVDRWEMLEVTMTPVPADEDAVRRSFYQATRAEPDFDTFDADRAKFEEVTARLEEEAAAAGFDPDRVKHFLDMGASFFDLDDYEGTREALWEILEEDQSKEWPDDRAAPPARERATYDVESYREKLYTAGINVGYDGEHVDAELDLMFESPDFLADEEVLDSDSFMADEGALLDQLAAKYPDDLVSPDEGGDTDEERTMEITTTGGAAGAEGTASNGVNPTIGGKVGGTAGDQGGAPAAIRPRGNVTVAKPSPVQLAAARSAHARAVAAEARVREIKALAMGKPELLAIAERAILEGVDVEVARKRMLAAHARANAPVGTTEPQPTRGLRQQTIGPAITEDAVLSALTGLRSDH